MSGDRESAARWLSLVAADTQLSAYLIGVDWERLKAQVARTGEVPCLGWSEAEQRRAESYLRWGGFWAELEDRCPGLLPEREAPLVEAALRRFAAAGDGPERSALLTVLRRAHRHYGLRPDHQAMIGQVLGCAIPWREVEEAAARVGDGPAWWPAEVVGHDRAAGGIAVLTVRPWRRLPFRPGQAVPVCTPRRPDRWRWLCPANAPRPDGTVELHVRAVPANVTEHSGVITEERG